MIDYKIKLTFMITKITKFIIYISDERKMIKND